MSFTFLFVCGFFRCDPNLLCANQVCTTSSVGTPSCGSCLPGYGGSGRCVLLTNYSVLRVSTYDSNTQELGNPGGIDDGNVTIQAFVGDNVPFAVSGASVIAYTTTGQAILSVLQGFSTIFGFPYSTPLPSNGIDWTSANYGFENDWFLTTAWVPRTLFPSLTVLQRAAVLTWQSVLTRSNFFFFSSSIFFICVYRAVGCFFSSVDWGVVVGGGGVAVVALGSCGRGVVTWAAEGQERAARGRGSDVPILIFCFVFVLV